MNWIVIAEIALGVLLAKLIRPLLMIGIVNIKNRRKFGRDCIKYKFWDMYTTFL